MGMTRRNVNIEDGQWEWLRKRAYDTNSSVSAILRDLIARATKEGTEMRPIEMVGKTLREVLLHLYDGKPAEQIFVDNTSLISYAHDLDAKVERVYAAVCDDGIRTSELALVAGSTVWQDCMTRNIVDSTDIEDDDVFKRTWVRIYPEMDAVFTHNNGYDALLINNTAQAALMVDKDIIRDFVLGHGDWADWGGGGWSWSEYGDTIGEAAPKFGTILAYYDGDQLTIVDPEKWEERLNFYGVAGDPEIEVVVIEAGPDYLNRLTTFRAELSGTESEMVAKAIELVAERGYRVIPNTEGGCCGFVSVTEGADYIGITVYPEPEQ